MSWGGRRAGAGRKSNAETERCRAILDKALSEADWEAIFKNQLRIASTGDGPAAVAAAKFLAHYRWGDPVEPEPAEEHIEPVKLIEVHLDGSRREVKGWKRDDDEPSPRPGQLEKHLNNQVGATSPACPAVSAAANSSGERRSRALCGNARPIPPHPKKTTNGLDDHG